MISNCFKFNYLSRTRKIKPVCSIDNAFGDEIDNYLPVCPTLSEKSKTAVI